MTRVALLAELTAERYGDLDALECERFASPPRPVDLTTATHRLALARALREERQARAGAA